MEIKKLSQMNVEEANRRSFNGTRGDTTVASYESYCRQVISWNLSDKKTRKILDKIHDSFEHQLSLEARHVSVMVAGASGYNAKKLDRADQILKSSYDFVNWFDELKEQAERKKPDKVMTLMKEIAWYIDTNYNLSSHWKELAARDFESFKKLFERMDAERHFKKNSIPYKLYSGTLEADPIVKEFVYRDLDMLIYREGKATIIELRMKPQRQFIVAMKSRGFHWNSYENYWSSKKPVDDEWLMSISERYAEYI